VSYELMKNSERPQAASLRRLESIQARKTTPRSRGSLGAIGSPAKDGSLGDGRRALVGAMIAIGVTLALIGGVIFGYAFLPALSTPPKSMSIPNVIAGLAVMVVGLFIVVMGDI
jgi:hypothetical protein